MVLKTALVLAQRFLTSTVVVILMLGTAMVWVWDKYEKTVEQRNQLAAERQAFNSERVAAEIALSERKTEVDKREFIVQQREKDYQEQLANVQKRETEYSVASAKLKQEQVVLSGAQSRKDAERDVQRLMSEFSAIGVNLRGPVKCDDADAMRQHNAARAKYSEIRTLVNAYGLKGRYDHFLSSNRESWFASCPIVLTSPFKD